MPFELRVLTSADIPALDPLVQESEAEGFSMLRRFVDEYAAGAIELNTARGFFLGAFDAGRLVAIGGVTPDPYIDDAQIGRLRHLYVERAYRRRGVGRQLVRALEERSRPTYSGLRLRTREAANFYAALGYLAVSDASATHTRDLTQQALLFMSDMPRAGKLLFLCGKMASGKSTLARELAAREHAVLFVQDEWLDALYPGAIVNVASYLEYAGRINRLLAPHVVALLSRGVSVVLDFPGNTRNQRAWFRDIIDRAGANHELHFVDTAEAICKAQLKARSAHLPPGTKWTTEEDFELISSHFRGPTDDEAFNIVLHTR
jgi:predicted kinase/GNAT superfamily N-acetyltransferase